LSSNNVVTFILEIDYNYIKYTMNMKTLKTLNDKAYQPYLPYSYQYSFFFH